MSVTTRPILWHWMWITAGQGRYSTPDCVAVRRAGWDNKEATLTANKVARATAAKRSPDLAESLTGAIRHG